MTITRAANRGDTLLIATSNRGKLAELSAIIPLTTKLVSLRDMNFGGPEETGRTFLDNAVLKARYASTKSGLPAIADDSGLEVDALSGQPGVSSARFAGPDATDADNNARLVRELAARGLQRSRAQFRCAVAFVTPDGFQLTAEGRLEGHILTVARGENGFGYDSHFLIDDPEAAEVQDQTVAELTLEEKNRISHRARAYDELANEARERVGEHPALQFIFKR